MKTIRPLSLPLLFMTALTLFAHAAYAQHDEELAPQSLSEAELEQILAPIALYPDTVLSHILVAATYPLEVIKAARWAEQNPNLSGSEALKAVENEDWDPSVRALVAFPDILSRLSEDLDWTQRLGDAFLLDEKSLLASVQNLRQRAYEEGSLDEMDKLAVNRDDDVIIIEPIEREVVYIPYYDSRVVYGRWHWAHYPPVYWDYPFSYRRFDRHYARHHSPFYWGPRVHLSFGFFFSSLHWHNHHVVRIPRHHYRPHRYYNHHQIVGHRYGTRWAHDPRHRLGVAYRHSRLSSRYNHRSYPRRHGYRNPGYDIPPRDHSSRSDAPRSHTTQNQRGATQHASPPVGRSDQARSGLRGARVDRHEQRAQPRTVRPAAVNRNTRVQTNRPTPQRSQSRVVHAAPPKAISRPAPVVQRQAPTPPASQRPPSERHESRPAQGRSTNHAKTGSSRRALEPRRPR
ncbi:MAG: DUF3300 domain-containing protein [Gammaproteobacteria bacterium]|nr:DUF3300 domain-containing protein [Gammaproteobacteria bacterium]